MKKYLRILIALSIAASSIISIQPASAVSIGALYDGTSGEVACTTGSFEILNNVLIKNMSNRTCAGIAIIPFGVTSIANDAFYPLSVTSVSIPSSVTTIGSQAFYTASLSSLTIPNSVTSIGEGAFVNYSVFSSYQYCGTTLTTADLNFAGLGTKTKTCPPSDTAPGSPISVVATTTGKRSATVSFNAPANNGGSAVTSYNATSTPGGLTQTLTQATGGTFAFDGLKPSTAYTFAVTATNAIGTSAAATSKSINTDALVVAALSALSFVDDGNGRSGKIVWAGMNIDSVRYSGPAQFYPGPFKYGAFTSGWNGLIRNLTPDTSYTISIFAHSPDGVGGAKSLTFKTSVATTTAIGTNNDFTSGTLISDNSSGIVVVIDTPDPVGAKLNQLNTWLRANTFVTGEASNMYGLIKKFSLLKTSPSRAYIRVPISRVSNVAATSLTPLTCSVISTTAAVNAGRVTAIGSGKCTISYTVTGGSNAPATIVRDFVFTYFELKCGAGTYKLKAGVVSDGESCTGEVTIDATATSMANAAFVGSLITSITLPNALTKIPDYAFAETYNLTKVELGNAVTSIGTGAFRSTGIVSILLPSTLRTLDNYVFLGSAITSLIIPVGTTTVGLSLFQSSLVFTTVTIPSTVTYMHPNALIYSGAKTINYCGNNASVLRAIYNSSPWVKVSATCVAPATAPVTSSNSNP